jgi:hypothetical protein
MTQVRVTASAQTVQTETGESSGVVSGYQTQSPLLNGRDFPGLGLLVFGVNSEDVIAGSLCPGFAIGVFTYQRENREQAWGRDIRRDA